MYERCAREVQGVYERCTWGMRGVYEMSVYILYPTKRNVQRAPPVNFWKISPKISEKSSEEPRESSGNIRDTSEHVRNTSEHLQNTPGISENDPEIIRKTSKKHLKS